MNQHQPLVSVVTPVYNGEKYLDECIRSVRAQAYENWEYIILNNSSTDRTLEIAEKYAATDSRIRIHSTDSLLPIMKNWNHALRLISPESKYCKVVHADDILFSKCLEEMVRAAEANPTAGFVGSYGYWGDRVVCDELHSSMTFLSGRELCRLTLLGQVYCFWSPSSLLIRSDLVRKRYSYYHDLGETRLQADVEACYETLLGSDFAFVHRILTFIRKHEDSLTSTVAAPLNRNLAFNFGHLLKYGPIFLTPAEFKRQRKLKSIQYYRFLADALFRLRGRQFWRFHLEFIDEIGFKIQYSKLLCYAIQKILFYPRKTLSILLKSILGELS